MYAFLCFSSSFSPLSGFFSQKNILISSFLSLIRLLLTLYLETWFGPPREESSGGRFPIFAPLHSINAVC